MILIVILVITVPAAIFLLKRKTGKSVEEQEMEEWKKEGYDVSELENALNRK